LSMTLEQQLQRTRLQHWNGTLLLLGLATWKPSTIWDTFIHTAVVGRHQMTMKL
jgi:hypothetical protein